MANPWLTWANVLTALRLTVIPALCLSIVFSDWAVAACLFVLAVVTDVFDGRLARKFDQASPLGGLLDHTTDALLASSGCFALATIQIINPYLSWLIVFAFLQYMLDSRALSGRPLRASQLGRINGVAYFSLVGTAVGVELLNLTILRPVLAAGAWVLVASSLISMGTRAWALVKGS